MTLIDTLRDVFADAIAEAGLPCLVAASPPPGHAGPCLAISTVRLRPAETTSLHEYHSLEVDVEVSQLEIAACENAWDVMRQAAQAEWQSERFRALSGRVGSVVVEREEHARQQHWVVRATIEYHVVDLRD